MKQWLCPRHSAMWIKHNPQSNSILLFGGRGNQQIAHEHGRDTQQSACPICGETSQGMVIEVIVNCVGNYLDRASHQIELSFAHEQGRLYIHKFYDAETHEEIYKV